MTAGPVLELDDLTIAFPKRGGDETRVVDGVSLSLQPGRTLGLVGESGSGKSMIALSIMGLVPSPGRVAGGRIRLGDHDISSMSERRLRAIRGGQVGMIFQDPLAAFNPVKPIGSNLIATAMRHTGCTRADATSRAVQALRAVGIASPEERLAAYPHELSGGQRQRVMIALATINDPDLILADEPTTALDTTIQAQILALLNRRRDTSAMIMITHDLGVAAEVCDTVAVVHRGRVVEHGPVEQVLAQPKEPYTRALLDAVPTFDPAHRLVSGVPAGAEEAPILTTRDLRVTFDVGGRPLHAVDGVDLTIRRGETVGVVGESGSGKSTIARTLMRMLRPAGGEIRFQGRDIAQATGAALKALRRHVQMVFQDPYASLDPRWTIRRILAEPLRAQKVSAGAAAHATVDRLIDQVGLPDGTADRLPVQFSGGQRQRIGIARALALRPDLIVADEPVSALDVTIQRQIVRLLKQVQLEYGNALLVIAHDLALVYQITDRIVVLYLGRIVEEGPTAAVIAEPYHPYTAALLSAAPVPDPGRRRRPVVLRGEPPSPLDPPSGCRFHPRCPIARDRCAVETPPLLKDAAGRKVACFYPGEVAVDGGLSDTPRHR